MNALTFAVLSLVSATTYTLTVSGGDYDGQSVTVDSGNSFLTAGGSGSAVTYDDQTGWNGDERLENATFFLKVGSTGSDASTFSVAEDGTFSYQNIDSFYVCPAQSNNIAWSQQADSETFKASCPNAVAVKLIAKSSGDAATTEASSEAASTEAPATTEAPAETSAASSEAAATTEAPAETSAAGETSVVEETVVETVCTQESCTGVTPANGAARNAAFGGVAAIVAALL